MLQALPPEAGQTTCAQGPSVGRERAGTGSQGIQVHAPGKRALGKVGGEVPTPAPPATSTLGTNWAPCAVELTECSAVFSALFKVRARDSPCHES